MRIACPSCNAVYQVPDEQLGDGRVVRCVRCGTDWLPVVAVPGDGGEALRTPEARTPEARAPEAREPEVQAVAPPAETLPEPPLEAQPIAPVRRMALDEEAASPAVAAVAAVPQARRGPWLAIAWVVSVLAVIGGLAALATWREAVMQAWPPSVRAYAAMGLAARP